MNSKRIRRLVQRSRSFPSRFSSAVLILLYHRVFDLRSDPQLLGVTVEHFSQHLEVLQKRTSVIGLGELAKALLAGKLPHRAVVLTFDDGYADNLHFAKPRLQRYEVPATVFITTGYVDSEREFWWDELERILVQPGSLPETLCLSFNGESLRWELGEAAFYSEDAYKKHHDWNVLSENDPTPRHHLYRSLFAILRSLPETQRRRLLDQLARCNTPITMDRPSDRALSVEEIAALADGGLVEIGVHTITHPVLSTLSQAEQTFEIERSKSYLEEILGFPINSFAYPYGSRSDYTTETVDIVREAGFVCACCNLRGVVRKRADRFQLPRLIVRDWDGDEFGRQVEAGFSG